VDYPAQNAGGPGDSNKNIYSHGRSESPFLLRVRVPISVAYGTCDAGAVADDYLRLEAIRCRKTRAISGSPYMLSAMVKPVFGILFSYPLGGCQNGLLQQVAGAYLCGAQPGFEFAESQLNGIEVGRIGCQVKQACSVFFTRLYGQLTKP